MANQEQGKAKRKSAGTQTTDGQETGWGHVAKPIGKFLEEILNGRRSLLDHEHELGNFNRFWYAFLGSFTFTVLFLVGLIVNTISTKVPPVQDATSTAVAAFFTGPFLSIFSGSLGLMLITIWVILMNIAFPYMIMNGIKKNRHNPIRYYIATVGVLGITFFAVNKALPVL